MYHAQLGQFIQRDPLGYDGGDKNLYNYVGNNPVNRVDPTGQIWLPGYGNYCGPRCGPAAPVDCVDRACRRHDACLATFGDWIDLCHKARCEQNLCDQVYGCDCGTSPTPVRCRTAKAAILAYACASAQVDPCGPATTEIFPG
jgi:hypothetical protein